MDQIPTFFSEKKDIFTYDYNNVTKLLDSDINHYEFIDNLGVPDLDNELCKLYFKSIMFGQNHIFIQKILDKLQTQNICLPLLHNWLSTSDTKHTRIDNLVIINDKDDSERICQNHVKKAPIFKSFLYDSIISTTDNIDWKEQRGKMNMAFIPSLSLKKVFPISEQRAKYCSQLLKQNSDNYKQSVNMSEFFLNETQAQLQLGMFGFSDEFEQKTNKKIRDAFAGIDVGYTDQFSYEAIQETQTSKGPLSKLFDINENEYKNKGNLLIFSFAGHDTTGDTLSWLLYELCKNPQYKQELIKEIDSYWLNHDEPTYDTLHELPFMTKCITETLRLWPALANGTYRELEYDETIKGIDGNPVIVKKGTYVQIMNWNRHRNKDLWGSDADIFNPHRQFKDSEIWSYKGFGTTNVSSDRFSPFTYGPRNCIGKNFSHMEMRLILLYLFEDYDFQLTQDQLTHNVSGINLFTMGPGSYKKDELLGLYVDVVPRKSKL
jgi:cytochrome P450